MIPVRNPRSGEIDYSIQPASAEQVAAEAKRLRKAQPKWQALGASGRADVLRRWADAIEARTEDIVAPLSVDTGRLRIARIEVEGLPRSIRRWADRGPEIIAALDAKDRPSAFPGVSISTRHLPYPLFGAIAPWNFPVVLSTIDLIPALMAGCAAVVKPSEVTPRFLEPLKETIAAVPELERVLAFVLGGPETGQALIANVDYVCFTGSVATGRKVAEAAARAFIPANLELGGKDPMIVLASADPVQAARTALRASVVASGQACQSIERVYVARAIAQPFIDALVHEARACRLNHPKIREGEIGPFIFARQAETVQAQIDDARSRGARVLTGGTVERLGGGLYLRPTVIIDVTSDMAIMREETFGPVVPVVIFDDVEEAIAQANDSAFGLSAAVLAGSAAEAEAVGAHLEAGAVSINDGALTSMVWDAEKSGFKSSGLGPSRTGDQGLTRFFRTQALIRQNGPPMNLAAFAEDA
ncbi:MAG TPA: aldehyde dehydrogenase family protein [Sphingomonas sp.]|jgi:acyl-CoA reductase-like NAD-dependent aldehyde dehydrogenase|nr:aldehyde dehydrogenase family protein [Sphingomonas sp.]